MQRSLIYSCAAKRGGTSAVVVLAECTSVNSNGPQLAIRVIESLQVPGPELTRRTYNKEGSNFHVVCEDGLIFLVIASESAGQTRPFLFLDECARLFKQRWHQSAVSTAVAFELNEFSKVLEERMAYYSAEASDPVQRVKGQLDEVKGVMVSNLEKVLERGEKLEMLVEKTELLQNSAFNFRREARVLHRTFFWRNIRMYVVLVLAAALTIYFILGLACGFKLDRC